MILCRIFIGFIDAGEINGVFQNQGKNQTLYVIDELAIKGFGKHSALLGTGESTASDATRSEFRESQHYSAANFIDKVVRPVIIQEHFGVRTTFSFETQSLRVEGSDNTVETLTEDGRAALKAFAEAWSVAVNVPDGARAIPEGATGVLVPRPYEGDAPAATLIKSGIDGLSIETESA